jgi:hypothetical protein
MTPRTRAIDTAASVASVRRTLSAAVLVWVLVVPLLQAQKAKPTDYQVKAVYLYNFGRFIEWPAKVTAGQDAFTICVLGLDPFGPNLDATLAGEAISGKAVTARRISNLAESNNCRILFFTSADTISLSRIIEAGHKNSVLTVSDMPQFTTRGGMIQFVLEDNRVRFEVNLTAAQNAGLTLSSELLKVATVVRRTPTVGD